MTQSSMSPLYILNRDVFLVNINVIKWCTSTHNLVATQLLIYSRCYLRSEPCILQAGIEDTFQAGM
jgi:hypothetical protein